MKGLKPDLMKCDEGTGMYPYDGQTGPITKEQFSKESQKNGSNLLVENLWCRWFQRGSLWEG